MITHAGAIDTYYSEDLENIAGEPGKTLKVIRRFFYRKPETFTLEQTPQCCELDIEPFESEVGINYEFVTRYFISDFRDILEHELRINNIAKNPSFEIFSEDTADCAGQALRVFNPHPHKSRLEDLLNLNTQLPQLFSDIAISVSAYKTAIELEQLHTDINAQIIQRIYDDEDYSQPPYEFSILVSQNSYFINIHDYSISFPNCLLD